MSRIIEFAPGAEENGFASMMGTLISQNIADHPEKGLTLDRMVGRVAIVVEDLNLAVTLKFEAGRLTVFDGIAGIPDVTMRTNAELATRMTMIELDGRWNLPVPTGEVTRELAAAASTGEIRANGALLNAPLMLRLTQLLAIG